MNANQNNSMPRSIQHVAVEIDRQDGYLCRTYELFEPATLLEYKIVVADIEERFRSGERSENERVIGGQLVIDDSTIERHMRQYTEFKAEDLPGILERAKANFWEENEDEDGLDKLDRLHRIEAIKRLITLNQNKEEAHNG